MLAEIRDAEARTNLETNQRLHDEGYLSDQGLQDFRVRTDTAREALEAARVRIRIVEESGIPLDSEISTGWPTLTLEMSVSSMFASTMSFETSATMAIDVPPVVAEMPLATIWPSSTSFLRRMPVTGARSSVSASRSRASGQG